MSYQFQDDPYCDEECFHCNQKDVKLDDARYWLQAVLDHMYTDEVLHVDAFENCLDELARSVGMKIPEAKLQMEKVGRTESTKINPIKRDLAVEIDWWRVINQNYAKQILNS